MKVLLLIDIQNDFLPGGNLAVPDGDQIIPVVNQLQECFDLVVCTQDWHPKSHKSFASNHSNKKSFDKITLNGIEQVLWPDHCIQGSAGAEFSSLLNMNKPEIILRKGTNPEIDSYSAFYDNYHLKATGLTDYLKGKSVDQVYVAGLAGDYCVYFSVKDALAEGFDTYLIEDACKPIDKEGFEKAKKDIQEKGGRIILSKQLLNHTIAPD